MYIHLYSYDRNEHNNKGEEKMINTLAEQDALKYWNLQLQAIQINSEAFVTIHKETRRKQNPIEGIIEDLRSPSRYTFGIYNEREKLLGVVTLLLKEKLLIRHKAYITGMYVDLEYRRKGHALKLLQAVIAKAKELNIEQLHLSFVSNNKAAKQLYQSVGFKTYAVEKKSLKDFYGYYDEEYMVLFL
ncbi:N-acetyltransferase [Bacillus thuringiensis serovar muju]|nr:hypothetical protein IKA_05712 [Bacillus cereus VD169]OTY09106.1 N-acetyltransferase [Bacillus thuringiensis serovar muju]